MNNKMIGFIGNGNMANALVAGLVKQGHNPRKIGVSGPDVHKLMSFQDKYGVGISQHNEMIVKQADILILAVKPQVLPTVAQELASIIKERQPLVISIVAGVTLAALRSWLGESTMLVRAMPNLPALIQQGISALYASDTLSMQTKQEADAILSAVGGTVWLDQEEDLDKVTALSGSGPAYFFWILQCLLDALGNKISQRKLVSELLGESTADSDRAAADLMLLVKDALKEAGCSLGLPYAVVHQLVEQTAQGSFYLAQRSHQDLATLITQVTSKGGTTEAGLKILTAGGLADCFQQALEPKGSLGMDDLRTLFGNTLRAAWLRAQELGIPS